jgi:hypothetical protein
MAEQADPDGEVVHPERIEDLGSVEFVDTLDEDADEAGDPEPDAAPESGADVVDRAEG